MRVIQTTVKNQYFDTFHRCPFKKICFKPEGYLWAAFHNRWIKHPVTVGATLRCGCWEMLGQTPTTSSTLWPYCPSVSHCCHHVPPFLLQQHIKLPSDGYIRSHVQRRYSSPALRSGRFCSRQQNDHIPDVELRWLGRRKRRVARSNNS